MGTGPILYEKGHSQLEDMTAENGAYPQFLSPIFKKRQRIDKEGSVYYFLGYEHPYYRWRSFFNPLYFLFLSVCPLQSSGERKKSALAQQCCSIFFNHHRSYFFS